MAQIYPVSFLEQNTVRHLVVSDAVAVQLHSTLDDRHTEQGGILGMTHGEVSHYYHDRDAVSDQNLFQPSAQMGRMLVQWYEAGIEFVGIVHSHPADRTRLSGADIRYAHSLLHANPGLQMLIMGIMAGKNLLFYGFEHCRK